MLLDFFYSNPTWLVGLVVVGFCTGVSLLGLVVFHNVIDIRLRRKDIETVGLSYAMVGMVYAVLIAFLVIDVFATYAKADDIVAAEANKLSNLMLDAAGLPPDLGAVIRADLNQYIDIVLKKEWPGQQAGTTGDALFEPGWEALARLNTRIAAFEPETPGQTVNKAEMLRVSNELIKARRGRILAAEEHVSEVVWQILLLGGVVTVVYTYLFGAQNFGMHLAITGLVAAMISLIFVLIIALDYPFRGNVSVSSEAFETIRATAADALEPGTARERPLPSPAQR